METGYAILIVISIGITSIIILNHIDNAEARLTALIKDAKEGK
jgi:hypothetical protein